MRKMSRTEHMMLSLWGARWKDVMLVPFTIYFDDSGTSPSQHVAIASALAMPASRLIALETEWERLKEKEKFSCFHMAEFAALNPKSEFATWADKQNRVAERLRQIIKKYAAKAFSMSVYKEEYEELVPEKLRKYVGKNHYTWAISNVLALLKKWKEDSSITEPFEYVFDFMGKRSDPRRKELEDMMELCEDISCKEGKPGEYSRYSFRNRCELPALQCADILAWTCYQAALLGFKEIPMKPLALDMWNRFEAHQHHQWFWARPTR